MMYKAWLDWKQKAQVGDKFGFPGTKILAVCDEAEEDRLFITLKGDDEVKICTYRHTSDKQSFFDKLRSLGWKEEAESVDLSGVAKLLGFLEAEEKKETGQDVEELLRLLETEGYLTLKLELEALERFTSEAIEGKRDSFSLYIERYKVEGKAFASTLGGRAIEWTINNTAAGTSVLKSVDFKQIVELWLLIKKYRKDFLKQELLRSSAMDKDLYKEKNEKLSKEGEGRDELDQGLRYNGGKNRLDLIPCSLIDGVGRVLTFGAQKYAPDNWRKFNQQQVKECIGSAMRHIEQYRQGNWLDPESGLPHLAHAATNLGFILELYKED